MPDLLEIGQEAPASTVAAMRAAGKEIAPRGSWRWRRSGHREPGGRLQSPASGRAVPSRGGTDAGPGCGCPDGPSHAMERPPGSPLHVREPTASAPATRRCTRCTSKFLLRSRLRPPGRHRPSTAVFAKAPNAEGGTFGSVATSGISAPGSIRLPSGPAPLRAAASTACVRCRALPAPAPRRGFLGPGGCCPFGPKCGCPARPSGCPVRALWRPPSSREAGARAEPERALQPFGPGILGFRRSGPCGGQSWTLSVPVPSTFRMECRVAHRPRRDSPCV